MWKIHYICTMEINNQNTQNWAYENEFIRMKNKLVSAFLSFFTEFTF